MSKEVAQKAEAGLPSADVMDLITEFEGDGLDYDTSELQIPFIRIIQAMSPQANKRDAAYIEGAGVGDVFNTVTGQHWDGEAGIKVIPCYQETKYLKFRSMDDGGGFLGELAKDDPDLKRTQRTGAKEILPDGNELVKSDQHYCIILDDSGIPSFGIVDMKSASLKVSKRWKTQLSMLSMKDSNGVLRKPAIYSTMWTLSTVEESNDKGTWPNWTIAHAGYVPDKDTFMMAKNFRESVQSGAAKAVAEDLTTEEGSSTSRSGEEAPF